MGSSRFPGKPLAKILGRIEHVHSDTVLHAAARIHVLELRENRCSKSTRNPVQSNHRRVANYLKDVVMPHVIYCTTQKVKRVPSWALHIKSNLPPLRGFTNIVVTNPGLTPWAMFCRSLRELVSTKHSREAAKDCSPGREPWVKNTFEC